MLRTAPDELEADFQREYRIDLCDLWRGALTPRKAAILAVHLPAGSAVWQAAQSPLAWDRQAWFLHAIEYNTRLNVWAKTKDGQDGKNQPEPSPTPDELVRQQMRESRAEIMARRFKNRQQDTST